MKGNSIFIRNHSNTLIIVLHEIYGINDHMKNISENYSVQGYDVICPDLLCGEPPFRYDQEQEAYLYFLKNIGFQKAAEHVTERIKQEQMNYEHIIVIGYSIGATIAWLCSGDSLRLDGAICFYGSRIRDFRQIDPKCPALLIFAEEENSFDPKELQKGLLKKEGIAFHILEGRHGFADTFSVNYNKKSADEADRKVRDFLSSL